MGISEHEYARLVRWVEQQQGHIAALEAENRALRRELADLRRGVGLSVVVQGRLLPVNPTPTEVPQPNAGTTPHPSYGPVPRPPLYSESTWITGQARASNPPAPVRHRPITPSQEMTPSWLRDNDPHTPPQAPAPRRTLAAATGPYPTAPRPSSQQYRVAPDRQQTARQRVPARPLPYAPEVAPMPSLAELTGQRPAIRIPGWSQSGERNPYSDSFVLE